MCAATGIENDGWDRVFVDGLEVACVIGANDWERLKPQVVVVDFELFGDFRSASGSDDLADAADYDGLCRVIVSDLSVSRFKLLESFADAVARLCLSCHGSVRMARVRVRKPSALAGFGGAMAGVEVVRSR